LKRLGSIFDEVVTFKNLENASKKALKGQKKFKKNGAFFYINLEKEIIKLEQEIVSQRYQPSGYTCFIITDPKTRKICAANFRDRVVHHAICNVIEPHLDKKLIYDTYACRKGKGTHAAMKRAQVFLRKNEYYLKCDIQKYFETINHEILKKILNKKLKDKKVIHLLNKIIDTPYPSSYKGRGVPIGNLTSQIFANLYLGELDNFIKNTLKIKPYLRYMDDFLVFDADKSKLHEWLYEINYFVTHQLDLTLKEKIMRIAPVSEGVPFLGFRIFKGTIRLQRQNFIRFCRNLKKQEQCYVNGEIDEADLIASVGSMLAHISHANTYKMRKSIFARTNNLGC